MVVQAENSDSFHLDAILEEVGSCGKYQVPRIVLILFILFSTSVSGYNYLFYSKVPDYRCLVPECESSIKLDYNTSWIQNAVPFKGNLPEKCLRYESYNPSDNACTNTSFDRSHTITCDHYIFNTKFQGIAREFNIYCDDKLWMLTLPATMHFTGLLISLPFSGYLADKFGRRFIFLVLSFGIGLVSELQAFLSFNYWSVVVFELLRGLIGGGAFPAAFTLLLEFFGPAHRTLGAFLAFSTGVMGESVLAVIAMNTKHWRTMVKISSFAPLLVIFYGWIVPESLRWLLVKQKFTKANKAINKMAKANGVVLELKKFSEIPKEKSELPPKETFSKMFKYPAMTFRIIVCAFCWITCVFVFYGITLGSVSIFGDMYLNFIMVALMEIPGNIGTLIFTNYIGRKKTLFAAYLLAGFSCIAFILLKEENWIKLAVFLLGKCSITCAFGVVYIYTAEMFPTPLRQRVMGICSSIGRIGSISAPQMPFLARIWAPLPYLFFGGMAITAGLLTLTYPETLNTKLPDTVEEALHIGKPKPEEKKQDEKYVQTY